MAPSSIQFYDFLMIAVLLLTTVHGVRKGLAWQVAALAALVVSAMVAVRFYPALAPYVGTDPKWNRYTAMLILYVGTSLGIWIVFRAVRGFIDRVKLEGLDHQMGGLFGFAKGIIWCLVITFFAVTLSEWARQKILTTYSGHYIAVLLQKGTPLLPDEVRGVLGKYVEELESKLATDGPPSPDVSPDTAIPDILRRELAPTAPPAPKTTPQTPRQVGQAFSPATPPVPASPVSAPSASVPPVPATPVSQPQVYDPPANQPPAIPPQALQPPANPYPPPYAPPNVQPPAVPSQPQPPPDYPDGPVPKGMQRVP